MKERKFLTHCPVCSRKLTRHVENVWTFCRDEKGNPTGHFGMSNNDSFQVEEELFTITCPSMKILEEKMTVEEFERFLKLRAFQ